MLVDGLVVTHCWGSFGTARCCQSPSVARRWRSPATDARSSSTLQIAIRSRCVSLQVEDSDSQRALDEAAEVQAREADSSREARDEALLSAMWKSIGGFESDAFNNGEPDYDQEEALRAAFDAIDTDGDERISGDELLRWITRGWGPNEADEDVRLMVEAADSDGDVSDVHLGPACKAVLRFSDLVPRFSPPR